MVEHHSRLAIDTFVALTMAIAQLKMVNGNRNSEMKFLLVMH